MLLKENILYDTKAGDGHRGCAQYLPAPDYEPEDCSAAKSHCHSRYANHATNKSALQLICVTLWQIEEEKSLASSYR